MQNNGVCQCNLKTTAKNVFPFTNQKPHSASHRILYISLLSSDIALRFFSAWFSSVNGFCNDKKIPNKYFCSYEFQGHRQGMVCIDCMTLTFRMDMESLICFSNRESLAVQWCFSNMGF